VLNNAHPCLHPHAADALGEIGDPQAVEALIAALQRTGHRTRVAAIRALAKIGDQRAVGPLVSALGDGDAAIRLAAASALCTLGRC
jgi:HEAT repeat protein